MELNKVREPRRKVLIRAKMRAGGPQLDVCIRDVSVRGMMMQAHAAPARGTYVEITIADRPIVGRVVWAKDRRFGIRASDSIDMRAVIGQLPVTPPGRPKLPKWSKRSPAATRQAGTSNRAFGRAMEFVVIGAFAAALAIALVGTAFQILANPLDRVSRHLTVGARD